MTRSAAIAAAYMIAVTQGCAMLRDGKTYGPADYLRPRHASLRRGFLFYRFPRHVRRIEIDVAVEVL